MGLGSNEIEIGLKTNKTQAGQVVMANWDLDGNQREIETKIQTGISRLSKCILLFY